MYRSLIFAQHTLAYIEDENSERAFCVPFISNLKFFRSTMKLSAKNTPSVNQQIKFGGVNMTIYILGH